MTKQLIKDMIDRLLEEAEGDTVKVDDMLKMYGEQSFGPVFTLTGFLVAFPLTGAIPGMPVVMSILILLFSVQMMFGKQHIWVPKRVRNFGISKDKLRKTQENAAPVFEAIDKIITRRLDWATNKATYVLIGALVSVLAVSLIPLGLIPMAVALPGVTILLIGLGILAGDGVLLLIGAAKALGSIWLAVYGLNTLI